MAGKTTESCRMSMETKLNLEAIEAAEQAATPGPGAGERREPDC